MNNWQKRIFCRLFFSLPSDYYEMKKKVCILFTFLLHSLYRCEYQIQASYEISIFFLCKKYKIEKLFKESISVHHVLIQTERESEQKRRLNFMDIQLSSFLYTYRLLSHMYTGKSNYSCGRAHKKLS